MLGRRWQIAVARRGTDDPALDRVRIAVSAAGEETPLAQLDGFLEGRAS
jgi:general secretion pathway protein I